MQRYLLARVVSGLVSLLIVTFIVFGMINLVPGDIVAVLVGDAGYTPAEAKQLRHELGVDRPLPVRYASWLGDVVRLHFGTSIKSGRKVSNIIKDSMPVSLELTALALVLTTFFGVALGVWSAVRQDKWDDYTLRLLAIAGISVPSFWIATMSVVLPAIWWKWAPPLFYVSFSKSPGGNIKILLLPAVILALNGAATTMRISRTTTLEVLREDFVRTARAKGLGRSVVLWRHVLKNTMLPTLTVLGGYVAFLFGGAVVVETVFNLPGIGTTIVTALHNRDFPVITSMTLVVGAVVIAVNLLIDMSYKWFDPRVTF
jgi:peptide/nickel transport system permease protein